MLTDAILVCYLCMMSVYQDKVSTTFYMTSTDNKDNYKQLLVNTYLTRIKEASDDFYNEYYTISPVVNYYSVFVKDIYSNNRNNYITFSSEPYLGPHDTIGIDEITFSADYLGNVTLEKFSHIISYHLPENLKDLEKKIVPSEYGN